MNIDNRDYEILNTLLIDDLNLIIKNLNIKIHKNIINDKDKLIKKILRGYYIDNKLNKLIKKPKDYNDLTYKYNLMKLSFMAGNDNNDNIIEMKKIKKII